MNSTTVRVVGIDPGYDRIGVAIVEYRPETRKEHLVFSTCITTQRGDTLPTRIFHASQELSHIFNLYQPHACAIEELFFSKNAKTALGVAQSRGAFMYIAMSHGVPLFEYKPAHIKQAITGTARATKQDMVHLITRLIRFDIQDREYRQGSIGIDDEVDAIAVALTHLASRSSLVG